MRITPFKNSDFYIAIITGCFVGSAYLSAANAFTCSRKNKVCHLEDSGIVLGDKLGFLTADGDLIATGTVTKMNGSKRTIELDKITGDVNMMAESYKILDSKNDEATKSLKFYSPRPLLTVGGHLGLATLNAGGNAKGFQASAEGIRGRFFAGIDAQAHASWYSFSGTTNDIYSDQHAGVFKANAFTLTAGPSYTFNPQGRVVVRTELGLGLAYTVAKINDSVGAAKSEDWGYQISSGVGLHLRGLLALGLKLDLGQLELGYEPAMLAGKATSTIVAGLLINLK